MRHYGTVRNRKWFAARLLLFASLLIWSQAESASMNQQGPEVDFEGEDGKASGADVGDAIQFPQLPGADVGAALHRRRREVSWQDVEKFYEDKNNFAMYLVLPIIVLVYGGCAVIYCIARCRRYIKRRKKKPKQLEALEEETEPMQNGALPRNTSLTAVSTNPAGADARMPREGASSSSEVDVDMGRDAETPLPWQVPGDKKPLYPVAAADGKGQPLPSNHYTNSGFEDDFDTQHHPPRARPDRTTTAPPPYEEADQRHAMKPPPYDTKGRRTSVDEIIVLDPVPPQDYSRKRRRPGSRIDEMMPPLPPLPEPSYDEEREKARRLVRGDRPRREPAPDRDRERTPDIISHARTKPLTPKYKPPHDEGNLDAVAMAKQAAQLLRLDHQGKQQFKKQKRLIFVAE